MVSEKLASAVINDRYTTSHLIDYVIVLLRRKKSILVFAIVAAILSAAYSKSIPDSFTATARLLVPQNSDSGASGFLAKIQGNPVSSLFGTVSASDMYVGILESRSVADRIIERFDLKTWYDAPSTDATREILNKRTNIESGDDQLLLISVKDTSPEYAADMANAYAAELERVNQEVSVTGGHLKRVFLEERLTKVKEDLLQAETRLKEFQEKYRLVALDEQAKVTIEGAAHIKGEIIAAQTELEVFKTFGSEKNKEAVSLKSRIAELNRQLARIETGDVNVTGVKQPGNIDTPGSNFYIPFNELPELGMQLLRLAREAKIQEELFTLVTSQYELAKIEEVKDINTIQILDQAVPADRESSPNRLLIVLLGTAAGFFMGMFQAFVREFLASLKRQEPDRYHQLVSSVRLWKVKS